MIKKAKKVNKRIYLDYAAGTPIDHKILDIYIKNLKLFGANPTSIYKEGVLAKKILEEGRGLVSKFLKSSSDEVFFTSGGTESNNLAILGTVNFFKNKVPKIKPHIITSSIEHPSILEPIKHLEQKGEISVTFLKPQIDGTINPKDVRDSLKKETCLVSLFYLHNEIGSINDIKFTSKFIREFKNKNNSVFPYFHTDACQAPYLLQCSPNMLGVDLMTLNSAKVYAPSGVGVLYKKRGISLNSIVFGGGQESGIRSGRELPASTFALGQSLYILEKNKQKELKRIKDLKKYTASEIRKQFSGAETLSDENDGHILHVSIPKIDSEFLVIQLDYEGVSVSSSSSCSSLSGESSSYVVREIFDKEEKWNSSFRLSFGKYTNKKEIDSCLKKIKRVLLIQQDGSPK